jgi:hypothetical protein
VKPYVADVIQKTLLKYPVMIASEVYRRDQDLGVLKPILKCKCKISRWSFVDGTELGICKL